MEDCKIKVVTSWDEVKKLRTFWESVQWHPGTDFNFFHLVLQGRSNILSPCVFVLSNGDQVVALLVGRIEQSKIQVRFGYATISKINVRKLVIMDGGFMGVKSNEIWTRFLAFIADYLPGENLDLASLENLQVNSEQYAIACRIFGPIHSSPAHGAAEHWLMRLPQTFEAFMANRSKKRRYWLNRLPRILDKQFPGEWSMKQYRSPTEATEFAVAAETVACKTYHRGMGVGFQANPETLSRLAMEAKNNQLSSYVLFIKKEPKAFWYCFEYANTLYLASTGYDPAFRSHEVGTVLLLKIFQDYCGTKIQTVDFGLGDAEYKQRYGSDHYAETSLLLFPKSAKGICLNGIHSAVLIGNRVARNVLDRLNITQLLKTSWRRRKARHLNDSTLDSTEDTMKGPQ